MILKHLIDVMQFGIDCCRYSVQKKKKKKEKEMEMERRKQKGTKPRNC